MYNYFFAPESEFWVLLQEWGAEPLDENTIIEEPLTEHPLFHYDEAFVPPCCLNEINCGNFQGKWTPTISMLGMDVSDDVRFQNE